MNKEVRKLLVNRYPKAHVHMDDNTIDVHAENGELLMSGRKTGAGTWECQQSALGARDPFHLCEKAPEPAAEKKGLFR